MGGFGADAGGSFHVGINDEVVSRDRLHLEGGFEGNWRSNQNGAHEYAELLFERRGAMEEYHSETGLAAGATGFGFLGIVGVKRDGLLS